MVLDTGVLLAALDTKDRHHRRCADLVTSSREELVTPAAVLIELEYFMRKRSAASGWLSFAERVAAGAYRVHPLTPSLLVAAARLQTRYGDLPLGLVDATVFLTCVELRETKVATLDRRHFSVLRTEGGQALQIVPEPD